MRPGELRKQWATMLAENTFNSKVAISCDDTVVHVLFSQINQRPPHRQHCVSTLRSTGNTPISESLLKGFRDEFEAKKTDILAENSSPETLKERTTMFLESESIRKWTELALDEEYWHGFNWYFMAYIALLAPWKRARIRVCPLAGRIQFSIFATQRIEARTRLYELLGTLSIDPEDQVAHTDLSTMLDANETRKILSGPLFRKYDELIQYEFLDNNQFAITLCTTSAIEAGEEISVDYGPGYFDDEEGGCACVACKPTAPKLASGPSRIKNEAMSRERKRIKNKERKARQRAQYKAKKQEL
ncbi:hypothetical protein DFH07DRAFT_786046 [Mycena maculata]|uniref:SET domain-containing protein n=1 Tax=Mycena maculata TaxID=230809 RepID=A0AAD7H4W0_9AGAR|nr:hypothetical protein DFH07DRAFT_786046 [Mycena maculata]